MMLNIAQGRRMVPTHDFFLISGKLSYPMMEDSECILYFFLNTEPCDWFFEATFVTIQAFSLETSSDQDITLSNPVK